MFIISLVGRKGGTGKTTLALGLAVAAARAGHAAVILDIDPQTSAARWKEQRSADNPTVISAQASSLQLTIETARVRADFIIIDTAGRKDDGALSAARASDLVLIPTRFSAMDIEMLPDARDIVGLAGSPPAFVLPNSLHASTDVRYVAVVRKSIEVVFGMRVAPVYIGQREAYAEALTSGLPPQELDAEGKTTAELGRLFKFTREIVNKRKSEQRHAVEDLRHSTPA
jgi:chromosome partitioning protein